MLALVVRLLLGGRMRRSGLLVGAGLACWMLSDFAYVLWASDTFSVLLEVGWMATPVLIRAAAWSPARPDETPRRTRS
jgi:hypothetical protein